MKRNGVIESGRKEREGVRGHTARFPGRRNPSWERVTVEESVKYSSPLS